MTDRLRIAHIVTSLRVAGAERFGVDLANAQRRNGHDAHVIAMYGDGPLAGVARAAGIPTTIITRRIKHDVLAWARLVACLRRLDPDIVHVHDVAPIMRGAPAARLACPAPIIGVRHDVRPLGTIREALIGAGERCLTMVVASSDAVAAHLTSLGARQPAAVIHCGIDCSRFPYREPARRIAPRLLTAGRLETQKGHDVLIEATARLTQAWPGVSLTIAGEGAARPALEALSQARGLAGRVRFAGVVADSPALFAEADVFCFPSRWEAQGLALLEAHASGLPVVASGVGGILETVRPDVTGVLVPPGDAASLANAVHRIAADPAWRRSLARAAREHLGRWDIEVPERAYAELYDEMLCGRFRPASLAAHPSDRPAWHGRA